MSILNLPEDVLEKILSYISYDEVSRCRLVCNTMNNVCKCVLNRGFHKVERYHAQCLRQVKAQLPRRESERRKHPLARHCDILTAVETRLSLLGMTFLKYMEFDACCFIPGKVLDEIYKVLRYVTTEQTPVRAHEVLQELRDLSSMAMEHFDERICPAFRKNKDRSPKINGINLLASSVNRHSEPSTSSVCPREKRVHKFIGQARILLQKQIGYHRELQNIKQQVTETQSNYKSLEKKVIELQNSFSNLLEKMKEKDLKIEVLSNMNGSSSKIVYMLPHCSNAGTQTATLVTISKGSSNEIAEKKQEGTEQCPVRIQPPRTKRSSKRQNFQTKKKQKKE